MCEDDLNKLDDFIPCKGEYIDTESYSQNIPSLKNLYLYVTEKQLFGNVIGNVTGTGVKLEVQLPH